MSRWRIIFEVDAADEDAATRWAAKLAERALFGHRGVEFKRYDVESVEGLFADALSDEVADEDDTAA